MKANVGFFILVAMAALCFNCTPKVSSDMSADNQQPSASEVIQNLGPCATFSDSPMGDDAITAHVLYRDLLKMKKYDQAFPFWQKAFKIAPAADGKRNTHFADGIFFYQQFYEATDDEDLKSKYVDTIFSLYDQMAACYGKDGYVAGRKAFDYYYTYKDLVDQDSIYSLFTQSLDMDGDSAYFFILNPFTDLLVRRYFDDKVSFEEAQQYASKVLNRLQIGLDSNKDKAQWDIINNYVPARLSAFEGEKGFFDCDYYIEKYIPEFEAAENDCEVINTVYRSLIWGGCAADDPHIVRVREARDKNCKQPEVASKSTKAREGFNALESGDFEMAIELFDQAADETNDTERQAQLYLVIAKIYYGSLKRFPEARTYALKAASVKDNWGAPYLLIGKLYASSGPLCGPGTGWDSQIVTWPAIDKWEVARKIDPESAAEASQLINRYRQYMPTKEDVFLRTLKVGDSFKVNCWIQETTRIRTVD